MAEHGASSEPPPERDMLLYEPDIDATRFMTLMEEVAASCGSEQQKMLVLFVDGEVRITNSMVSEDKFNTPGGAAELLQTDDTTQYIPITKPPFEDKKFRNLWILCDENACMKRDSYINDVASRLLGDQVYGALLRGNVIVAGVEESVDDVAGSASS